ncbi:MAG: alpha/beta hydrolase, partial [Bacteroidota bacterium]
RSFHHPILRQIDEPIMLAYYYKNEMEQDKVVSVEAMKWMMETISTPKAQQWDIPFPDADSHVIASDIASQDWQSVQAKTIAFIDEVVLQQEIKRN